MDAGGLLFLSLSSLAAADAATRLTTAVDAATTADAATIADADANLIY